MQIYLIKASEIKIMLDLGWTLSPVTGVLTTRGEDTWTQRKACEDGGRAGGNAPVRQGVPIPATTGSSDTGRDGFSLRGLTRN